MTQSLRVTEKYNSNTQRLCVSASKNIINFLCVFFLLAWLPSAFPETDYPRQQQLLHLLKQDCGSCHGMTFNGGLGPALLPENLHDKPDEMLIITILEGRPGTPMPPWKSELSRDDAAWLVKLLRNTNK
jgi:cytochrome c55X